MRVRLNVAYKGTDFHGFARQRNDEVETVAGRLEVALFRYLRTETKLTCAGRTDAGVHALGQVVSFDVSEEAHLEGLVASLNKQIGSSISVSNLTVVSELFDARFSAKARHYRYLVSDSETANPLYKDLVWWVGQKLDIESMSSAAVSLLGENDYTSFCKRPDNEATLMRRVISASWSRNTDFLEFHISANAFCHQMVRSIVGELIAVGKGKRTVEQTAEVLASKDRSKAASIAPPHGLCLVKVDY